MAQIHVPLISPFSVTGPLHGADDSHIQSHHLAYEIAALNRSLEGLLAKYEAEVALVTEIQVEYQRKPMARLAKKLKSAEKLLMASFLPHQIKILRARLQGLNQDMLALTHR